MDTTQITQNEHTITTENVSVWYGDALAIRDISISFSPNQITPDIRIISMGGAV